MTGRDQLLPMGVWAQVAETMLGEAFTGGGMTVPRDEVRRWADALGNSALDMSRCVSLARDLPTQSTASES